MAQRRSANRLLLLVALASLVAGLVRQTDAVKIDCHPIDGATKEKCQALGCVWSPVERSAAYSDKSFANFAPPASLEPVASGSNGKARVDEPWCYYPDDYVGYRVVKLSPQVFKLTRISKSALGDDIKNVEVRLEPHNGGKLLQIKVIDVDSKRFEPELPKLRLMPAITGAGTTNDAEPTSLSSTSSVIGQFKVKIGQNAGVGHDEQSDGGTQQDKPFWLTITRGENNVNVFSTDLSKLIYSDKFIQLTSQLSSPFVYGLGEHYDNFLKFANTYKVYSFYNTDQLTLPGGTRSYGGFPFYINLDSDNNTRAHGVYLRNSNAMDIVLQNDLSVTFRPIGGILDFYIFIGPTPLDVASQFQQLVGLPDLPPRWSLGFHLCRYDYKSLDKTMLVWQRTREAGIPFDVQWNDIDYMERGNDFTYDPISFKGLPEFVDELHKLNMHYTLIFDPGLSQEDNYYPYQLGEQMGIFVRNATNQTLVGKVWNQSGRTVFPDFSHKDTTNYWSELFVKFQQELKYDGAWIDMNDISNFVDGSLDGCPIGELPIEQPPYLPGGVKLQWHSLCLSAQHRAGSEYNLHNLYSFYEAIATHKALTVARPGRRPFIISRSTHPGQGHYGGHWSGDVLSTWGYLRWSIPSLLEHNMYGFNMMGSDICGFVGDTTPQLCSRWSTLGAFYTFSRNHNDDKSIDQDPVALGPEVVKANKNALTKRYSLLPYLYTLIHKAHNAGIPVARSMTFEFFDKLDKEGLRVEDQFMWGPAVLISPIVEPDTYTKTTYLPHGRWYELDILPESMSFDAQQVKVPKVIQTHLGTSDVWRKTDNVALVNMPIFYRGGYIIPIYADVRQTVPETVAQPVGLEIALCEKEHANGELTLDDGDSIDPQVNNLTMRVRNRVLKIEMVRDDYTKEVAFGKVKVYGLTINVAAVKITSSFDKPVPFEQKEHMIMFDLAGATVNLKEPLVVEWS